MYEFGHSEHNTISTDNYFFFPRSDFSQPVMTFLPTKEVRTSGYLPETPPLFGQCPNFSCVLPPFNCLQICQCKSNFLTLFDDYSANPTSWPSLTVMKYKSNFMTLFYGHEVQIQLHDSHGVQIQLHDPLLWPWSANPTSWPSFTAMKCKSSFMTLINGHEVQIQLHDPL